MRLDQARVCVFAGPGESLGLGVQRGEVEALAGCAHGGVGGPAELRDGGVLALDQLTVEAVQLPVQHLEAASLERGAAVAIGLVGLGHRHVPKPDPLAVELDYELGLPPRQLGLDCLRRLADIALHREVE